MPGLSCLSDGKRRFLQPSSHTSPFPMTVVVLTDALSSSGEEEHRLQLCEILNSFGLSIYLDLPVSSSIPWNSPCYAC